MRQLTPRSTRNDTLFPNTTLFRSEKKTEKKTINQRKKTGAWAVANRNNGYKTMVRNVRLPLQTTRREVQRQIGKNAPQSPNIPNEFIKNRNRKSTRMNSRH